MKLNAKELRDLEIKADLPPLKRNPIYLILDNVYDTYNIGGLFRLSDALAVSKIYLCGMTETPPNHRILKASIGTYKVVPWEYHASTIALIKSLKKENPDLTFYAIEQRHDAIPYTQVKYKSPVAFIVGNETSGISDEVLNEVHTIVEIPMHGINISLNVIVSAAIVTYHSIFRMRTEVASSDIPKSV